MFAFVIAGIGVAALWALRGATAAHLLPAARDAVFSDLRDAVFVLDTQDRIVDSNVAAEHITGRAAADMRSHAVIDMFGGQLAPLIQQARLTEATVELEVASGSTQRAYQLRVLPVDGDAGEPLGRLVVLRDITAYKHSQTLLHATFLAEASAVLASSLDYENTLQQVARLAVPALGDWCTVYMLGDDAEVRRVAVAYTDGEKAELALALRRYPPSPVAPRSSVAEAMRTGTPILTPIIPHEYTATIAQDSEHLEIMRRLAFRSSMTVPLQARGEVLGALAFFSSDPDRRYGATDLALAEDLARRAGLAVDNARLYSEAQQAIRARDEFLSVAAHELKTPLTSMLGFSQVLLRHLKPAHAGDARIVQRALHAIEQQSDRLSRLVSRLLDVARIEAGRLAVEPVETDIIPLVAGVVDAIRASGSHEQFQVDAPRQLVALVDPLRFEQVVTNLLDNAAKFSPRNEPITIDISTAAQATLRIAITDHGPGIPPENRDQIFDRFYQAHAGDHAYGMGLGLYICRQIVEQHHGSIHAEFPAGEGTRFVVSLPLGLSSSQTATAPAASA